MMTLGEIWANFGSVMAGMMFFRTIFQSFFPQELRGPIRKYGEKLRSFFYPFVKITFPEYQGDISSRNMAYVAIERYIDKNFSNQAKRFQANVAQDCELIVLSMQDSEEVIDEYQGIMFWWASEKRIPVSQSISLYPKAEDTKKYFTLTFHKKYREIVGERYLKHVFDQGKAIIASQRQRKLYTNSKSKSWSGHKWSHVTFKHPSTFDTLALEAKRKQEIIDDLIMFRESKEYYAKIGKAWKRGYLLYGPPGTGKSSMIAAMANFLNYDVYDLELTSVEDNVHLRKLLIDTSSKSIIVIEDIDCSLDLTGQREKEKEKSEKEKDEKEALEKKVKMLEENKNGSQVTLSGLLNFIDGLWSACGGERIIVFTTNYVEKLDPALIRRGRMDKHIQLSYCGFEAFKVLANNYLNIESHQLFPPIESLLEETNMTPADVAENLMPKSAEDSNDVCLERLIKVIEKAKEDAKSKAEKEAKQKAKQQKEKQRGAEKEENNSKVKSSETLAKDVKQNGAIAA